MGATDRTVTSGTASRDGRPTEHQRMLKSKETSSRHRTVLKLFLSFATYERVEYFPCLGSQCIWEHSGENVSKLVPV